MNTKKIEQTIKFIEGSEKTEKEIKDFLFSLKLSKIGVDEHFTTLFKYDLLTYNDNVKIELKYKLLYFPRKTFFVVNERTQTAINQVVKTEGTYAECEAKQSQLIERLQVDKDRFIIV